MIASLSLARTASRMRPSTRARASARSMATARTPRSAARAVASQARTSPRAATRTATRRREAVAWETRTFAATAAAILAGFVLAVVYLGQITGVSVYDYEMQRLEAQRVELRRTAALLDIQLAKLDSPARIENQALRLGLVRVGNVPVINVQELAARK